METFVILFSATNKLALIKGQVYRCVIVGCEVAMVQKFIFGLTVSIICGTAACAKTEWVCLAANSTGQAIVNLGPTSLVMFDAGAGLNGPSKIEALCSNSVCFGEHISKVDAIQYIIMNIDYMGEKPSAMLATGVSIKDKEVVNIYSEPTKIQLTDCVKFQ